MISVSPVQLPLSLEIGINNHMLIIGLQMRIMISFGGGGKILGENQGRFCSQLYMKFAFIAHSCLMASPLKEPISFVRLAMPF